MNLEKGREKGHQIFLRPSAGIHFTLNRPYSGGSENKSPDQTPMVPAKVVLSKEDAHGKDLVPVQEVLFLNIKMVSPWGIIEPTLRVLFVDFYINFDIIKEALKQINQLLIS